RAVAWAKSISPGAAPAKRKRRTFRSAVRVSRSGSWNVNVEVHARLGAIDHRRRVVAVAVRRAIDHRGRPVVVAGVVLAAGPTVVVVPGAVAVPARAGAAADGADGNERERGRHSDAFDRHCETSFTLALLLVGRGEAVEHVVGVGLLLRRHGVV